MMRTTMLHVQTRKCGNCGLEDSREIQTYDAAFVERHQWNEPCRRCGSTFFSYRTLDKPEVSDDLLQQWCMEKDLSFSPQDEDLFVRDCARIRTVMQFVANNEVLTSKRRVLLAALCIWVYDGGTEGAFAASFLRDNLGLFSTLGAEHIDQYIKDRVFSRIGIHD